MAVPERSTTDVVTAVNFDYRGFDTLGEEFILFAAVIGVASSWRGCATSDRGRDPTTRRGPHAGDQRGDSRC